MSLPYPGHTRHTFTWSTQVHSPIYFFGAFVPAEALDSPTGAPPTMPLLALVAAADCALEAKEFFPTALPAFA